MTLPTATPPTLFLSRLGKTYPDLWRIADRYREAHGNSAWPACCFMPIVGWYEALCQIENVTRLTTDAQASEALPIAALGAWRVSQGIYRFDPALYEALTTTRITGDIPYDVLYHLPEWCVYLETPGLTVDGRPMFGFWAQLYCDMPNDRVPTLWLMANLYEHEQGGGVLHGIHVGLKGSLLDGLRTGRPWAHGGPPNEGMSQVIEDLQPMMSLLLYLCSENADYSRPPRPIPKRTKRGMRLFPPDAPRTWEVGVRLGAELRRASATRNQGEGESPTPTGRAPVRPHVRRAHWHTYWRGPLNGDREPILRWLPPIAVAIDGSELPAVVHPVAMPFE